MIKSGHRLPRGAIPRFALAALFAARLHAFGQSPRVEEIPEPRRQSGTTLVTMIASAVTHLDLTVASGRFALKPQLPFVPGAEGAGFVLESDRFAPGALVRVRGAGVGLERDGLWTERAVVPDAAVSEAPRGCDPVLLATYFSPTVTAYAAVNVIGALGGGERVAVVGASGVVGALTLQLAARKQPRGLFALNASSDRSSPLPANATALSVDEAGWLEALARDGGVDVLIDFVGGEQLPRLIGHVMRPGGRVVVVGYVAGTDVTFHLPNLIAADVSLLPLNLLHLGARLETEAAGLLQELTDGRLRLPLFSYPLTELTHALSDLATERMRGRVVLICNEER